MCLHVCVCVRTCMYACMWLEDSVALVISLRRPCCYHCVSMEILSHVAALKTQRQSCVCEKELMCVARYNSCTQLPFPWMGVYRVCVQE